MSCDQAIDEWEVVSGVHSNSEPNNSENAHPQNETSEETVSSNSLNDDNIAIEDQYDEEEYFEEEEEEDIPILPVDPSRLGLATSYKDAVISNKRVAAASVGIAPKPSATKKPTLWKPVYKIEKVSTQRTDRTYGNQLNSLCPDPEDDDIGMSDLINAHLDNKFSSAATRYRSITMLTPGQQMTKNSRISAKAAK